MTTPANVKPQHVDAWVMRCIFNASLLVERVAAGELHAKPKNKPRPSNRPQDPPGAQQQMFLYLDRNEDEVATVHFFHLNGAPLSGPDPKAIYVGKIRYLGHPKDDDLNPEKRYFRNSVKWQKRYGCYRKLMCCLRGPITVVPLAG